MLPNLHLGPDWVQGQLQQVLASWQPLPSYGHMTVTWPVLQALQERS